MESRHNLQHLSAGGEAGGDALAIRRRSSPESQTRQDVNNSHFSGKSRTHIGNVYNNNTFSNVGQASSDDATPRLLMDALQFIGMRDRLFTVSPACDNTCSWVVDTEEYISWRDPARRVSHNGVLWIKGKVGTGKSTLMRYIHDHTDQEKASKCSKLKCFSKGCTHPEYINRIAFFFNGRSPEALVKSTEGMYRSLLHQLYKAIPRLQLAAAQRVSVTEQHSWSLAILEDLFREAVLGLQAGEDVICYIDALDECETDQVRLAIECFEALSQSLTKQRVPFLVCFSSRHYPQITMRAHVELLLESQTQHSDDISKYVDDRLTITLSTKRELREAIEIRCSGVFLWVVLVVRMLKQSYDTGATRTQLHKLLSSLPRELNVLYSRISQFADTRFIVAMRWVLFSEWPLKPQELYFAILTGLKESNSAYWDRNEISPDAIQNYILDVSRGLIECTQRPIFMLLSHPGEAQFIHESVREWLLSYSLTEFISVPQHILAPASHAKIAVDCQQYLKICVHGQRNMMSRMDRTSREEEDDPYPLGYYAVTNVFTHLQTAYIGGSFDVNILDFPVSHYTSARQYLQSLSPGQTYYVPNHVANLMTALIESECFELAEHCLQINAGSESDPGSHVERCDLCAGASKSSETDAATFYQGLWGSPLQTAVAKGNVPLVRLLLQKGAEVDPSQKSFSIHASKDNTPARSRTKNTSKAKPNHGCIGNDKLLANATARYWERTNALHLAMRECGGPRYTDVLEVLIKAGADVNAVDAYGETALIRATSKASISAAKLLLDHGANAQHCSANYGTAVDAADYRILKPLLSAIRLRALKGRDGFLPVAPRPTLPDNRKMSRIARPVQVRSQRVESPLRYRGFPQRRRVDQDDADLVSVNSMMVANGIDAVDGARVAPDPEWWTESRKEKSAAANVHVSTWLSDSSTW